MGERKETIQSHLSSLLKSSQKKSQMKHVELHWCNTGTNTKKNSYYKEKKEKERKSKEERKKGKKKSASNNNSNACNMQHR